MVSTGAVDGAWPSTVAKAQKEDSSRQGNRFPRSENGLHTGQVGLCNGRDVISLTCLFELLISFTAPWTFPVELRAAHYPPPWSMAVWSLLPPAQPHPTCSSPQVLFTCARPDTSSSTVSQVSADTSPCQTVLSLPSPLVRCPHPTLPAPNTSRQILTSVCLLYSSAFSTQAQTDCKASPDEGQSVSCCFQR